MEEDIKIEIAYLENEARYELNSLETRSVFETMAHLLRHGYRIQPAKEDRRIMNIIHLASKKTVYETTQNELRYTRIGKAGWLRIAQQGWYQIAEALEAP
jgi:hypothetical protein